MGIGGAAAGAMKGWKNAASHSKKSQADVLANVPPPHLDLKVPPESVLFHSDDALK
ncbi:MAG: hypothetical protein ACJAWN_000404 [Neolewinella sp.]